MHTIFSCYIFALFSYYQRSMWFAPLKWGSRSTYPNLYIVRHMQSQSPPILVQSHHSSHPIHHPLHLPHPTRRKAVWHRNVGVDFMMPKCNDRVTSSSSLALAQSRCTPTTTAKCKSVYGVFHGKIVDKFEDTQSSATHTQTNTHT